MIALQIPQDDANLWVYGNFTNLERDNMIQRSASATWLGEVKQGKGTLSTQSGTLKEASYSYPSRFENDKGTNPEELIAAAHAGCFTMALNLFLGKAGFTPEKLTTNAILSLEQPEGVWTVTRIDLAVNGLVPNLTPEKFEEIALEAKKMCPISRLLKCEITLMAKLI